MAVAGCLSGCGTPSQPGPRSESSYRKRADFEEKKDDFKDKEREKDKNRFNTEAYSHIVENPFLAADRNPLSTFATSVDTASYGNVRRFLLQEGKLPPPDAVRVAELVNYFPYTYPAPVGEHPIGFTTDIVDCPWNAKHHLVRIGLAARKIDPADVPRNFVFLIDTSGSMDAPNRLPLLKSSLKLLVEQLTERDRVAIVTYAGTAGLALDTTPGSNKTAINRVLDRLHASGSTNGGEGIVQAYRIASQNFIKGGLNRVILGTDGDFNVGVTNEGDLVRLIEEKRKSGVYLTILGFGMGNLKDATMEKLAYHGNGDYAYIDTREEARKIFVEQGASLAAVAKDVKLQIEFNPLRVGAYRLIGYEERLLRAEDFNDDRKAAGVLGAGHTVTALYEVVPAGQPINLPGVDPLKYQQPAKPLPRDNKDEWLTVKLRYKDPDADTETDASKLIVQPLSGKVVPLAEAPVDCCFASAVAEFGLLLRNSEYKGEASYSAVKERAKTSLGNDPNGHRSEFLKLVDSAERLAGR
jgi:Ca-activated chloride channel family protein